MIMPETFKLNGFELNGFDYYQIEENQRNPMLEHSPQESRNHAEPGLNHPEKNEKYQAEYLFCDNTSHRKSI